MLAAEIMQGEFLGFIKKINRKEHKTAEPDTSVLFNSK